MLKFGLPFHLYSCAFWISWLSFTQKQFTTVQCYSSFAQQARLRERSDSRHLAPRENSLQGSGWSKCSPSKQEGLGLHLGTQESLTCPNSRCHLSCSGPQRWRSCLHPAEQEIGSCQIERQDSTDDSMPFKTSTWILTHSNCIQRLTFCNTD